MRAVGGASSIFSGRWMLASGMGLPSKPRVASCGSEPPTVMVPAIALYAIDWPLMLTMPSVVESGVVGVAGVCGAAVAAGFSSGFSCAMAMVVAVRTDAIVKETNDTRRLCQGKTMD